MKIETFDISDIKNNLTTNQPVPKPDALHSRIIYMYGSCINQSASGRVVFIIVQSLYHVKYLSYLTEKHASLAYLLNTNDQASFLHIVISRGAGGPGREILQRPPSVCPSVRLSVCPSVTFSFRTVTQKRIAVFSRNFAGTCTKSWGCAVQFLILMECCLNFL